MKKHLPHLLYKGLFAIIVEASIVSAVVGILLVCKQFTATNVILLSIVPVLWSFKLVAGLKLPDVSGYWSIDIIALLFMVSWVGYNLAFVSQSVFLVRDPGVYTVTAKWLTSHKNTDIPYDRIEGDNDVFYQSLGIWRDIKHGDEDVLQPQGSHLLPGMLAFGAKLTNEKFIFKGNVIFGGIALCAVYLFAIQFMRRWWAFIAVVILGVSLPFLYFARDAYTEIIAILFAFSVLATIAINDRMKHTKRTQKTKRALWLLIGIMAGAGCLARPDGYLVAASILCYLLYGRLFRAYDLKSSVFPFILGLAPLALFAYLDLTIMTTSYYEGHGTLVKAEIILLLLLSGVIVVANKILRLLSKISVQRRLKKLLNNRNRNGLFIAVLFSLFLVLMYSRPIWYTAHSGGNGYGGLVTASIQQQRGDVVDGRRNYAELSFQWVSWYIGEIVFVMGLIGLVYASYTVVARKDDRFIPPLIVLLSGFLLYAIKPSITPDQIWAVRRFLPVAIPGMIVFSLFTVEKITQQCSAPYSKYFRVSMMILVSILLLTPALTVTKPFAKLQEKNKHLNALIDYCQQLPENAYVIWIGSSLVQHTVQTTRTYCGRQSAGLSNFILKKETPQRFNTEALKTVSKQLRAQGYEPIAAVNGTLKASYDSALFSAFSPAIVYRTESIEQTLSSYPTKVVESYESIELARIDENGKILQMTNR